VPEPAIGLTAGSVLTTGVTLTDQGNGAADLDGTSSVAAGSYTFDITASNGVSPDATQSFTLNVRPSLSCGLTTTFQQLEQAFSNILKDLASLLGAFVGNLKS
jgi:hypothetical protein